MNELPHRAHYEGKVRVLAKSTTIPKDTNLDKFNTAELLNLLYDEYDIFSTVVISLDTNRYLYAFRYGEHIYTPNLLILLIIEKLKSFTKSYT